MILIILKYPVRVKRVLTQEFLTRKEMKKISFFCSKTLELEKIMIIRMPNDET